MKLDVRVAGAVAVLAAAALGACGGTTASPPAGVDGGGSDGPGSASSSSGSSGSGGSSGGSSGSSSGGSSTDAGAGRVPQNHRPSDAQCSTPAPPGSCSVMGSPFGDAGCQGDTDCTVGLNPRCINGPGGPAICGCTYDACVHDNDCPGGQTCACHASPYAGADGNTCVQGDCRIDADCGTAGYCSPTLGPTSCGRLSGYYCHTASDLCVDDGDCPSQSGAMCMYSPTHARWECQTQSFAGCPV